METKQVVLYENNEEYFKSFNKDNESEETNLSYNYKYAIFIDGIPSEVLEGQIKDLFRGYFQKSEEEMLSVFFSEDPRKIEEIKNNLKVNKNPNKKTIDYNDMIKQKMEVK